MLSAPFAYAGIAPPPAPEGAPEGVMSRLAHLDDPDGSAEEPRTDDEDLMAVIVAAPAASATCGAGGALL